MSSSNRALETVERLKSFAGNPIAKAVASVLVPDQRSPYRKQRGQVAPDPIMLQRISDATASNTADYDNIMQLLPDVRQARDIIVASILSPKDLTSVDLVYKVEESELPAEMTGQLLEIIKTYFEKEYKIDQYLEEMLAEALFDVGSYSLLVVPESSIDQVINGNRTYSAEDISSHEGFMVGGEFQSMGVIGPRDINEVVGTKFNSLSFESNVISVEASIQDVTKYWGSNFRITDNINAIKIPDIRNKLRKQAIRQNIGRYSKGLENIQNEMVFSAEEISSFDDQQQFSDINSLPPEEKRQKVREANQLINDLYVSRGSSTVPVRRLKSGDQINRPTVGHPMISKLPAECIIPVHLPSDPKEKLGYWLILDANSNFVSKDHRIDHFRNLENLSSRNGQTSSNAISNSLIMESTVRVMGADSDNMDREGLDRLFQTYIDEAESDLKRRLRNGVYGDDVKLARVEEVWRIMLHRQLNNQATQLLFVPAEMITYIAFQYNEYGIGESLLEKGKILAGMRSALTFTHMMGSMKNSIGTRNVKIRLDETDPDPDATIEAIQHTDAMHNSFQMPLTNSSPTDQIQYIAMSGTNYTIEGHPGYPETTMDVEYRAGDRPGVDTEFRDELRKLHYMSMGADPDIVDRSTEMDFAATVINGNTMFTKRNYIKQLIFTGFVSDFMRKVCVNSGIILSDMKAVIGEYKDDVRKLMADRQATNLTFRDIIDEFLDSFRVELPAPDTLKTRRLAESYQEFENSLELTFKNYVPDGMLQAIIAKYQLTIDEQTLEGIIRSSIGRHWMQNNNMLPELESLLDPDTSEAFALGDGVITHIEKLAKTISVFLKPADEDGDGTSGTDAFGGSTDDDQQADDNGSDDDQGDDLFNSMPGNDQEEEEPAPEEEPESEDNDQSDQEEAEQPEAKQDDQEEDDDDINIPDMPA